MKIPQLMTWPLFACGGSLGLLLGCLLGLAGGGEPTRLLVPAYGNPCCGDGRRLWQGLIEAARPGVMEVILNPQSGPGPGPIDVNYVSRDGQSGPLLQLAQAGASILGYVHTRWAARDLDQVLREIDRYFDATYYRGADFRLNGLFVDEMSNDLAHVDYYRSILQHVRSKSREAKVVGNPGTASVIDSSRGAAGISTADYATVFDQLVTFENHGVAYRNAFSLPRWIAEQPAERFAHIVHSDAARDRMVLNVQLARNRNVGTLYLTDDQLPNPYDRLPTYWPELLAEVIPPVSIDELSHAIRTGSNNHHYDLNQDGQVGPPDHQYWVESVAQTTYGDANLDGRFDSSDLVAVYQAGEYEDAVPENSRWSSGDWNGDGDFDSQDLKLAFELGNYENRELPPTQSRQVPEPARAGHWLGFGLVWWVGHFLRRR